MKKQAYQFNILMLHRQKNARTKTEIFASTSSLVMARYKTCGICTSFFVSHRYNDSRNMCL